MPEGGDSDRPKWRIALDELEAAVRRGVFLKWLCADEGYGRCHDFRLGVADLGITYYSTGWKARQAWGGSRPVARLRRRGGGWEL